MQRYRPEMSRLAAWESREIHAVVRIAGEIQSESTAKAGDAGERQCLKSGLQAARYRLARVGVGFRRKDSGLPRYGRFGSGSFNFADLI